MKALILSTMLSCFFGAALSVALSTVSSAASVATESDVCQQSSSAAALVRTRAGSGAGFGPPIRHPEGRRELTLVDGVGHRLLGILYLCRHGAVSRVFLC